MKPQSLVCTDWISGEDILNRNLATDFQFRDLKWVVEMKDLSKKRSKSSLML